MDDVTSKLKKLFKSKPKTFKGSGHKLGASPQATSNSNLTAPRPCTTPLPSPNARPRVADKPSPPVNARPALGLKDVPPTRQSNVPPASVLTTGAYIAPEEQKATPAQQSAYSLLSSDPHRTASAEVLSKVLKNIVSQPTEAKYRQLKMNNKKVQDTVVNVNGALELLQACGFELVFEDGTPEPQAQPSSPSQPLDGSSQSQQAAPPNHSGTTGYLWFPEEAELWLLQAALQLLQPLVPLPFSKASNPATSQPFALGGGSTAVGTSSAGFDRGSADVTTSSNHTSSTGSLAGLAQSSPPQASTSSIPAASGGASPSLSLQHEGSQHQRSSQGPAASAAPATSSAAAAAGGNQHQGNLSAPRERNTQVLLPAESDTQVADEVFERSSVELKQAFMAAKKKREQESMLMTRAYREKLANKQPASSYTYAVVRIRLPEGLLLQGEFNAKEPVTAIFEWVSDSLRDVSATYELVSPGRKTLSPTMGTVAQADLLPTALLNFRASSLTRSLPTLRHDLLKQVQ